MSDIILIDKNVVTDISRGNVRAAEALKMRLKTGTRVYIAQAAYNELVTSPGPLGKQYRALLNDLGIETAPVRNADRINQMRTRVDVYNQNIQHEQKQISKRIKGPGQMTEYGGTPDVQTGVKTRPGDAFVAAEAKSLRARLWTMDRTFARQAQTQGINLAPETNNIQGISGTEDVARARRLLGLKARRFSFALQKLHIKARVVRLASGIRGAARTVGGFGVSLGINIVLSLIQGWMAKKMIEDSIKDGLKKLEAQIDDRSEKLKPQIAKLQLKAGEQEQVYVNITIQVHYFDLSLGAGKGKYTDVEVRLADVNATTKNINSERMYEKELPETDSRFGRGTRMVKRKIDERVQSFAVEVYSPEELDAFRDLAADYQEYKRKLRVTPADPYLLDELRTVKDEIIHSFGPEGEQIASDEPVKVPGGVTGANGQQDEAQFAPKTPMKL